MLELPFHTTQSTHLDWTEGKDAPLTAPILSRRSGLFVRDRDNRLLGGALFYVFPKAATPHVFLDTLFMSPALRGKGLGRKLMTALEIYTRIQSIGS